MISLVPSRMLVPSTDRLPILQAIGAGEMKVWPVRLISDSFPVDAADTVSCSDGHDIT